MLVPIACRFVPYDQWLLTRFDDGSKVKHAKHWILSKCNFLHATQHHPHRPVSPITFAPTVRNNPSLDSLDDGYNEDDEFSDQDLSSRTRTPSTPVSLPASSPLVDQYTLLSFSTGSILEDEFTLSWYNIRPYELLEMHSVGTIAPLYRDVLAQYIQPYFQAKVRAIRAVWNHKSARFEAPVINSQRDHKTKDKSPFSPVSSALQSERRRKTKLDWKNRWVVIDQGCLSLCKDRVTNPPVHQFPLSAMRALRGTDALGHAFPIVTQPRAVCIRFGRPGPRSVTPIGVVSPPPSSPSSLMSEDLKNNTQEAPSELRHTIERVDSRERFGDYAHDPCGHDMGDGEWVILDMLNDNAFSSILRVLHRQASYPVSSSFVPLSSIITVSHHSTPSTLASIVSHDTVPYPEWRINTVENARKAGIGDVGKAMAWVLWTEQGHEESLLGNIRHHRQAFSREMQYKTGVIPDIYREPNVESDSDSEMEWDGWMRDLERQRRVKQRSESTRSAASRQGHVHSSISSPLPSPPLSEASPSGSPRGRSPSLPVLHHATVPFSSHPHAQFPNIGDVIQASGDCCTELARTPERIRNTTVSTVSIGMLPPPRRRSSTLSTEMAKTAKRVHDKGKQDKEPFPIMPVKGARVMRSMGTSASSQRSTGLFVRHVHSSSNLRTPSSPIYESDAADSSVYPGPSSPSKRQSAFMRTMSLRAGKLVRGLESAIDFVDDKTT